MAAELAQELRPATDPGPLVQADLATEDVGLVDFAKKAGKNIFSVIPDATRTQTYLKGPANMHYVCDPEMVTDLLAGVGRRFPKSQFTHNVIGPAVGNGMILSEGQKWKDQRHRYAPLFAARNLPVLTAHFAQTGEELGTFFANAGGKVDVADAAQEATLTNISRVMFSGNEAVSKQEVRNAMRSFTDYISYMSLFDLMGLPKWVPRKKWLKSKEPIRALRKLARDVIETRQAKRREVAEDFLDLLIEALESDREDIDTTVDNLLTFVAAGYETSANTIAWGLYLLAMHPDAQAAIRQEVLKACPSGPIAYEDLPKMPLLQAHVKETLRLYPAGALFARDATEETTIKDVTFKKGDVIMFPVYSLHRNEKLWEDAQAYRLDRFLNQTYPRGQYIPFGDGPRICIGAQYAEAEIMVLLASVLRRVVFTMSDAPMPGLNLTFTMRPGGPILLNAIAQG
ncbi:cytochrome P450 [Aestuariivita boseongensis]|uniref:cytochrome P450 n=1 Tax=Aestuariivita boseongensis TaxID=1470562 RepID=UPI000680A2E9|nr:cytochrome P450 [Aestuariivita boseongensis]